MNFSTLVRSRLETLGFGQRDLARAARVTDSYVSQLLTRKKAPPAFERTDIYPRMEAFLQLEKGELARLAAVERVEEIKRRLGRPPEPLFQEFRDLVLRKCVPEQRNEVKAIFERQPFGTLERLVTHKLLEVVQGVARRELDSENWIRLAGHVGGRSQVEMRVFVFEFLDADVFSVSLENCRFFLDPLIESWDIDLPTFGIEIVLSRRLAPDHIRKFEFVETEPGSSGGEEPGLTEFLRDSSLSGDASEKEIEFLRKLKFRERRPTSLYFYRELQNLRDPLHFREPDGGGGKRKRHDP